MIGLRALRHAGMWAGVSLPAASLIAYAVLSGGMANPLVGAGLLVVGFVLAATTVLLSLRPDGVPGWWTIVAAVVGVTLLPVLLVEGLDAPVDTFSLLFVLVLVMGGFTLAPRLRLPIAALTLLAWFAALWWGGIRAYDLLLLHLGAGMLIVETVRRTAYELERATNAETRARAEAERRAELLGRTLQVHTLERDEVLQAVLDGLEDVGFSAVSVRVVDGDQLVLAAGWGPTSRLPDRVGIDEGLAGRAARSGNIEVVSGARQLAEVGMADGSAAGAIAVPATDGGRLQAVVTAVTPEESVQSHQRETMLLLSSLTGGALRRARSYEADERTVNELQRLETRTQDFVSTVSHELRTPLTVVQGLGQTLRTRWDDLAPTRRQDLLRRVDANAARLAEMVRSLLDTSAFEEGRIEIGSEPVALRELVDGLLHRLASVTAAHPVVRDIPEDLHVRADRSLLGHVLENLLTNIAKHTPQGTRVEIQAWETSEGRARVSVADDGPGIPEEDLPHVRDRFYRGGDPVDRPAGGLGLGLALADQILLAHDSELMVASEEGVGATFFFDLPVGR